MSLVIKNQYGTFKAGDHVSFKVENQYSGGWFGPLNGVLMEQDGELQLLCEGKSGPCIVSIGKGYDAYEGSIRKWVE